MKGYSLLLPHCPFPLFHIFIFNENYPFTHAQLNFLVRPQIVVNSNEEICIFLNKSQKAVNIDEGKKNPNASLRTTAELNNSFMG